MVSVVKSLTNIQNMFQAIPGVSKIKEGYNPATWMLEVSSSAVEVRLETDFAEVYANSELYRLVAYKFVFFSFLLLPTACPCVLKFSSYLFSLVQEKPGTYQ